MASTSQSGNVAFYDQIADVYSLFFRDLERNMEKEGTWLAGLLRGYGNNDVLDACCGTGRHAIPLLQHGFRVIGADPSSRMLREANDAALSRGLTLPLVQLTFTELPLVFGADFDAVIALGNGLCNLELVEDIIAALTALHACCRMDGVCIVGIKDFDTIRFKRPTSSCHRTVDRDGVRTTLTQLWAFDDPLLVTTTTVTRGVIPSDASTLRRCETTTAHTREYMLGSAELVRLAREAGFSAVERLEHPCEAVFGLR